MSEKSLSWKINYLSSLVRNTVGRAAEHLASLTAPDWSAAVPGASMDPSVNPAQHPWGTDGSFAYSRSSWSWSCSSVEPFVP